MADEPPTKRRHNERWKTKRDIEEKTRNDRAKQFRVLVTLPAKGLPYNVVNKDNYYIKNFYKFTLDNDVKQDFLHEYVDDNNNNNNNNNNLFEWETIDDDTKKITLKGVLPLWSYLVVSLLQVPSNKIFPKHSSCPERLFPEENGLVDIDLRLLKTKLRFTSVESLVSISIDSIEVKEKVGRLIGSNFDMISLCDSEGLASEDFRSYLDYIGLYVHLHNQVSY